MLFPTIDPIIFHIYGPIALRWYGLAYILGIFTSVYYIHHLSKSSISAIANNKKIIDDMIFFAAIGIILGGRIGYVLFYNLQYYLSRLLEIIKIWEGGMSFHGGLIGLILAIYFLCKKYQLDLLTTTDLIACAAPIGLFFGRIANFINGELIGKKTHIPWGVVFPNSDGELRHPSQLYEAFLEGILLFFIIAILKEKLIKKKGALSGWFLIFYSAFRTTAELFREPDRHIGYIGGYFTAGQILGIPMLLFGISLVYRANKKQAK